MDATTAFLGTLSLDQRQKVQFAGKSGSSYYGIQGPKLVIEFSPQGVGGDPTMHVHTIYRDPTDDYGVNLTHAS